ncbi:MAG: DUF6531 domain-containing protein, partial [Gammaproteobacteria bacterium]
MHRYTRFFIGGFLILGLMPITGAEEIRDYYAEPGLNPFKETLNQSFHEHIDPFSGSLQHQYTDIHLPGNGGLDIKVQRVYTSLQEQRPPRGVTGVGWTMHFGRIVTADAHKDKLCNQYGWAVSTADNPSIEFPDGGRELLVLDALHGNYLISKRGFRARCVTEGLEVTSPEGTVYTMNQFAYTNNEPSWHTTAIRDRHGNSLEVQYKWSGVYLCIDRIRSSDGREITYEYLDEGSVGVRLGAITANGQTWRYHYSAIAGAPEGYYQLTEVERPDGLRWRYAYYPSQSSALDAGRYSLQSVTYPYGAHIGYTYQKVDFDRANQDYDLWTTAVATKTLSGASVQAGEWRYEFQPYDPNYSGLDKTTVTTPNGTEVYYHYGYSYSGYSFGILWTVGLLFQHDTYDPNGTLLESVTHGWSKRRISDENFWQGRLARDIGTYAALPSSTTTVRRNGGNRTAYSNYDSYGNAHTRTETSNLAGDPDRVTSLTYYVDPGRWILHQVEDETIARIGTIDRSFDERGDLITENKYGVLTTYTYTPEGDLASATDARGNTVRYSDYLRGIAEREEHPEGVVIQRSVNLTGT